MPAESHLNDEDEVGPPGVLMTPAAAQALSRLAGLVLRATVWVTMWASSCRHACSHFRVQESNDGVDGPEGILVQLWV